MISFSHASILTCSALLFLSLIEGFFLSEPKICRSSRLIRDVAIDRCSLVLWRKPSKWDTILDGDDEEDAVDYTPSPNDMQYNPRNVQRAHQTFLAIRGTGGKELTNDVYVRDPTSEVFWYAGKVARVSDVTVQDCVARQWPMIERHAVNLRPLELYSKRGTLEIWVAPGDSELDVAYNRPHLQMKKQSKKIFKVDEDYPKEVKPPMVGFQGEIYQENEDGFRTWRTTEGWPARPEINPGGETRPPTEEEYAQIQKQLKDRNISALYEEQERRMNRDPKPMD